MSNTGNTLLVDRAKQDLFASLVYLNAMVNLFGKDTAYAMEHLAIANDRLITNECDYHEFMYYARTLIRAFFAQVDGVCYVLRRLVLWAHDRAEIQLSDEELYLLSEGDRGTSGSRMRKYNSVADNLVFSCAHFSKLFGDEYLLNKSTNEWAVFRRAIAARHAITHPKDVESFVLPARTLEDIRHSIIWFSETMKELLKICGRYLEEKRRERDGA